jgi:hypothetical protein
MSPRAAIVGMLAGAAVGTIAGILIEHYVGTAAIIDWSGLRHTMLIHQSRPTHERSEVPLDTLRAKDTTGNTRTMVALAFGQSNAANAGETPGPEITGVYEYYRRRLYRARDPLLGADGTGGSLWLPLAGKALGSGSFDAVVLVPFAISTTEIARWAPGGNLHDALIATIQQAQRSGLRFTHLLWQQGEADAQRGTTEAEYRKHFLAMLVAIRQLGVDAPIYVANTTFCSKARTSETIRRAQKSLIDERAGIRAGPDTDTLTFAERYDGCHFSTEGTEKAAQLWWQAIQPR